MEIYKNNKEIAKIEELQQIQTERNIKHKTFEGYLTVLKHYANFHKMTIPELLEEARHDEETIHLKKNRTIKSRLLKFRSYLIQNNNNYSPNTIKGYLDKLESFYNHFEIEIPNLPNVKLEKEYKTTYADLPTKEHIRIACEMSNLQFKALILFMSSSGTARSETLSLTVRDFIRGCKDYTNNNDIQGALQELQQRNDIVPTLYLKRNKTGKYYYTFCSPEASTYIIKELIYRKKDIKLDDPLFDLTENQVLTYFQRINDKMEWGKIGRFSFFRSHVLRKYHASNIGLPPNIIDELEGRSKNIVHDAYMKTNTKKLKQEYMKAMHNVMIGINNPTENQNIQPRKIQHTYAESTGKIIPIDKISYFNISNYDEIFSGDKI